ncbi:MAG: hypothetical protein WDN48_13525 [Pseudolabrys sp.]
MFNHPEVNNVTLTVNYSSAGGSKIVLTGRGNVATNFLGALGYSQLQISASTTSTWGNTGCGWHWCSTYRLDVERQPRCRRSRPHPKIS